MNSANLLISIVAVLFGGYRIVTGFQAFRRSRYHFYWISGLLIGGPFLLAAGMTLLTPNIRYPLLEALVILCWIAGELLRNRLEKRAMRADPERWARWSHAQEQAENEA